MRSEDTKKRGAFLIHERGDSLYEIGAHQRFTVGGEGASLALPGLVGVALEIAFDGECLRLTPKIEGSCHHQGKPLLEACLASAGDEVHVGGERLSLGVEAPFEIPKRRALSHDELLARAGEELARAERTLRPASLLLLRLSRDDAVRFHEIAADELREGDLFASTAPNEAIVFLPDTGEREAALVILRLIEAHALKATIGVAHFPSHGGDRDSLLFAARAALNDALQEGRPLRVAEPIEIDEKARWLSIDPLLGETLDRCRELLHHKRALFIIGERHTGRAVVLHRLARELERRGEEVVRFDGKAMALQHEIDPPLFAAIERGAVILLHEIDALSAPLESAIAYALAERRREGTFLMSASDDPERLAEIGRFDADLLALLDAERLRLPPLRRRQRELLPLAQRILSEISPRRAPRFSPSAIVRLRAYSWPGNLLELHHALHRAERLSRGGELLAEYFPSDLFGEISEDESRLRAHIGDLERDTIIKALSETNQNQTHAARRLGISRRSLIYKMEKYGLKPPPRPSQPPSASSTT